jgi:hypothetical protein
MIYLLSFPCYLSNYPSPFPFYEKKQTAKETSRDESVPKKPSDDGKVVLDIIEAIHAAEKKQADVDAYMYSEEKRKLKVCYSFIFTVFLLPYDLYLLKI